MATVNRETMDRMERVVYFVREGQTGLRQLPFELVTIDHDFQAYWPLPLTQYDSNMRRRRGRIVGTVILDREVALPIAPPNIKDQYATWEYHGR